MMFLLTAMLIGSCTAVTASNLALLSCLHDCLYEMIQMIQMMMIQKLDGKNILQLNTNNPKIVVTGSQQLVKQILQSDLKGPLLEHIKPVASNLGVWLDSNLSFDQHVTKLVQACFYHLRNISES